MGIGKIANILRTEIFLSADEISFISDMLLQVMYLASLLLAITPKSLTVKHFSRILYLTKFKGAHYAIT